MPNYRTCTHTDDSGHTCQSAAAKGRDYCGFHLRYRGRLLRQAQYRARHQRFDLTLPPLDSLCSIQSALCQVAEALAADMIDPRRAQGLLKALRFAKENLKDSLKENADWHATPYHTEDAEAYDRFESDYGLPENIDVSVPPEVSFPPPESGLNGVILSERSESKDPFVSPQSVGGEGAPSLSPAIGDRVGVFPVAPKPSIGDFMAEAEAAMQVHPEDIELMEINYDRFVAEANAKNIQNAAERLYQERIAAEHAGTAKKPPASAVESVSDETKNTA